ncbi:MAG: metallophosphoesterase [Myxococcales bacterium]|nr:metallophosphoesterase [Myxococcales bacterium]
MLRLRIPLLALALAFFGTAVAVLPLACGKRASGGESNKDAGPGGGSGGFAPADAGEEVDAGAPLDGGGAGDAGGGADAGPAQPIVRFAAIGDTGKGNQGQYDVARAVAAKCAQAGCDFVILLGDNIYDTGVSSATDPQFQTKFEQPYADINLPFYAVLGNHDYGGNGMGNEFDKGQYQVDYSQISSKWKMPAPYYRFTREHVEFFAVDTNSQMYGRDAQQKSDIAGWLSASTATWKIALGHHPYLSNGKHGNAGEYDGLPFLPIVNGKGVKDFLEGVVCGKVDLYLCGHDHSRQWPAGTCNGTELAISGAGASTTELPGSNPYHFQANTLGLLYVRVEGNRVQAEFSDVTGKVEYTRIISK